MYYVTTRQKTLKKKTSVSWLDLLNNDIPECNYGTSGSAGTVTKCVQEISPQLLQAIDVPAMIRTLQKFNEKHENLFQKDRKSLYRHFTIPKKSGGERPIDAPCDELQAALAELKKILTEQFGLLYHTAAFAYVKKRSTVNALYKHKKNESNWYLHTDFSGFFPSTTLKFTMQMMEMIFPASEICKEEEGRKQLEKALSLCFLDGGLPQGTVISPTLSNIVSIPIDYRIFNDLAKKRYVYTRYADDIHISCVQSFNSNKMVGYIRNVLKEFNAPWFIKNEKTHYGSRKGHNYCLGLCVNAENKISTGWKSKKYFKAMTANLIMDYKNKKPWKMSDIQHYTGLLSYYEMVEKEYFDTLISRYNWKFNVDLKKICKELIDQGELEF